MFFGKSCGTILIHGREREREKKKIDLLHCAFKKIATEDFCIVCVRWQLIAFIPDRPPDSRDMKQNEQGVCTLNKLKDISGGPESEI